MAHTLLSSVPVTRARADGPTVEDRNWRARSRRMTVRPLGDGRYGVTGASGHRYLVSLVEDWCTCPAHLMGGARCNHLHRVSQEVAAGSVPGPDQRITLCAACDRETAVPPDVEPPLCRDCWLRPGEVAIDRETGDPVVVVAVLTDRADEVAIPEARTTVAAYPGNRSYPSRDPVVHVVYPGSIPAVTRAGRPPKRYAFPISRLRPMPTVGPADRGQGRGPVSTAEDALADRG